MRCGISCIGMLARSPLVVLIALSLATAACKDQDSVVVHRLTFKGVKAVEESKLRGALATKQSSRIPWGKKYYFDRSKFDEDLKRLRAFYADRGFPDARVGDADVKLNDKQDAVDISITIDEGQPVRIAAIDFQGFDVISPDELRNLTSRLPIKTGEPRDRQAVVAAHEMALNELRNEGYPYAKVAANESEVGSRQVRLTFSAEPGHIAYFGPVRVEGNKTIGDRVVERQLTYKRGDLYKRSRIQDSQRRLYAMEVFQFVNIEPQTAEPAGAAPGAGSAAGADERRNTTGTSPGGAAASLEHLAASAGQNKGGSPEQEPASTETVTPEQTPAAKQDTDTQGNEVPTRVTVVEGKHQRVNFGVGYGTEEKARVDAEYHHLNFLGGARSAGAHVRYSSLDRGIRLDFNQPYLFSPHLSFAGEGQQWYTFTPAYNSVVRGAKATVVHRTSAKSSWAVSLTSEHDLSSVAPDALNDPLLRNSLIALGLNPITGEQNGTLNSLGFDIQHATADSLLNAHRGYQLAFHVEQAGQILPGSFRYTAITGDARYYLPIRDTVTLASRVQLGNLRPQGNNQANVPFSKLYFLGGATSIRGWGIYEVSPLSESGLPIGGDSMFAFSEELRAILRGNLGGVLFLDAGNVWAHSWGIRLDNLRYAVGSGLRYQTPIGPIRFDFGYQLNPEPGLTVDGAPQTRRWRVHFSIGQAF
jgi:outer membrane protein assembly factor BamA